MKNYSEYRRSVNLYYWVYFIISMFLMFILLYIIILIYFNTCNKGLNRALLLGILLCLGFMECSIVL